MAQHRRDHRGRSRLSVRTRNRDGVWLESHQLREHFSAWNDGNRALSCLNDFRIVIANGSRANNNVRMADVLSSVTFKDLDTHLLKSIGDTRTLQVGTGDAET